MRPKGRRLSKGRAVVQAIIYDRHVYFPLTTVSAFTSSNRVFEYDRH